MRVELYWLDESINDWEKDNAPELTFNWYTEYRVCVDDTMVAEVGLEEGQAPINHPVIQAILAGVGYEVET